MGGVNESSQSASGASESWSQSLSSYFSNALSQNYSVSQNFSQSGTQESRLSQMQGDILQQRNDWANQWLIPELQNSVAENTQGSAQNKAVMEQQANAINTAYDAARKSTEQTLSQQGLLGSPTGVNASLQAANNRARSSSLAQAYYNQLANSQQNKNALLTSMAQLAPGTTGSAEYHQSSTSQGTSSSQGTSVSESGGQSSSQSEAWSKNKSKGSSSGWHIYS